MTNRAAGREVHPAQGRGEATRRALPAALLTLLLACALWAETFTLETFYPSPAGVYSNLTTTGATLLARDSGSVTVGDMAAGAVTSAKLEVSGRIRVQDGSQSPGRVLTSDERGVAAWMDPRAVLASGAIGPTGAGLDVVNAAFRLRSPGTLIVMGNTTVRFATVLAVVLDVDGLRCSAQSVGGVGGSMAADASAVCIVDVGPGDHVIRIGTQRSGGMTLAMRGGYAVMAR